MSVQAKRRATAWLLLSVFVTTLVFTSLHHHQSAVSQTADCTACAEHVHHAHLQSATVAFHDCLLCQLCHLPFLLASSVLYTLIIQSAKAFFAMPDQMVTARLEGRMPSRAPPSL